MDGLVWEHPVFLWLILPAWAWWGFGGRELSRRRRAQSFCLAAIWSLLAAALAGPDWRSHPPAPLRGLVFIRPTPGLGQADFDAVWRAIRPGLEPFAAGDSLILQPDAPGAVDLAPLSPEARRNALREAMDPALDSPEDLDTLSRRLAAEPQGEIDWLGLIGPARSVSSAADRLTGTGLRVRAVRIEEAVGPDATVVRVRPPDAVRSGEPIEVWIEVLSNQAGPLKGQVRIGDEPPTAFELEVAANEVTATRVELPSHEPGRHELTASLRNGGAASVSLDVAPRPRVLWWGRGEPPSVLRQLFEQRGWSHEIDRGGADPERWDLVVLGEGFEADPDRVAWIERFVVERGGGLLVLGGPAQPMAAWAETPLGELFPVTMAPRPEPPPDRGEPPESDPDAEPEPPHESTPPPLEQPTDPELEERVADTISLALVLDTSGSMAGRKIAAAKKAAWAAAEALDEADRVSILTFDSESRMVLGPTLASDRTLIRLTLAGIGVGGETRFAPALEAAWVALEDDAASVRHVIFLSDGRAWPEATRPIVEKMRSNGITLSTVGLGEDHDHEALGRLAAWGGGHYYYATVESVPQIFAVDVNRVVSARTPPDQPPKEPPQPEESEESEESEPESEPEKPEEEAPRFRLELTRPDALTSALSETGLPELSGYEAATPRPRARPLVEVVGRDDVIVAVGVAGLGRVGVWTSGLSGPWGSGYSAWPDLARFLGRWTTSLLPAPRPVVTWRVGWFESRAVIEVEVSPARSRPSDEVVLLEADREEPLALTAIEPGRFRAILPLLPPGERFTVVARNTSSGDELGRQSWAVPERSPAPIRSTRVKCDPRGLALREHLEHREPLAWVGLVLAVCFGAVAFWIQ